MDIIAVLGIVIVIMFVVMRESDRKLYMERAEKVAIDARCKDLEVVVERERKQNDDRCDRMIENHEREIARLDARHAEDRKMLIDTLTFGTVRQPATREDAPPDVDTRVREMVQDDLAVANRIIDEEAAKRGAEKIVEMYKEQGLSISFDEALLQAKSIMLGRSPDAVQ